MTSVTSFVSYHYFAHILTQENLKKDAQVLRQNAQQLESSVQELMIITRNLLADPQLQQFCHTEDPDYFQREEAAELLTRYLSVQDLLHSALILREDQVLWNLYPLDQTFDALKTPLDEIRPAGFTEAFQIHSGVDSLWAGRLSYADFRSHPSSAENWRAVGSAGPAAVRIPDRSLESASAGDDADAGTNRSDFLPFRNQRTKTGRCQRHPQAPPSSRSEADTT